MLFGFRSIVAAFDAPALLSSNSVPHRTAASGSSAPVFSSNGLHLVFLSDAPNLVANDNDASYVDVFVHDLATQSTELLSVSTSGVGGGSEHSYWPAISADGRFVSLISTSKNLAAVPPSSRSAQLVRDRATGQTIFGASELGFATMSADGRFVAFDSGVPASDLPDGNNTLDVVVRDWRTSNTVVVSVNMDGSATASGISALFQVSSDGRYVLFTSVATDLVSTGPTNRQGHLFIRDVQSGTTHWVSKAGDPLNATTSLRSVMSDDGRYVVYQALPVFGDPYRYVFFYDVLADTSTLLTSNTSRVNFVAITPDGSRAAFNDATNVFVWDRNSQSKTLVSIAVDGLSGGNGPSYLPVMSADGKRVCFLSAAENLVTNSVNGRVQIYLRDLDEQTTRLLTRNTNGAACNRDNLEAPTLTPDGRYVAFASTASDLVEGDFNEASDVFLVDPETDDLKLISRPVASRPTRTRLGSQRLWPASLSSNGNAVAFTSTDNTLAAGDTNRGSDVVVFKAESGTLEVINAAPPVSDPLYGYGTEEPVLSKDGRRMVYAAAAPTSAESTVVERRLFWRDLESGLTHELTNVIGHVSLSQDGRWVGYHSTSNAADLAGVPDSNNASDVFVRDMHTGSNYLASWSADGTRTATVLSSNAVIAPDGRHVLFQHLPTSGGWMVVARDMISNRTEMVSGGPLFSFTFTSPRFQADFTPHSRFVVISWELGAYDHQPPLTTERYEFATRTRASVCTNCRNASLSADGRFVAYETLPAAGERTQIFVRDMVTGTVTLLSRNIGGSPANGHSYSPQVTPDGRFIVFESKASDLVPNDTNSFGDIFLADRLLGTRMPLSVNRFGATADALSSTPLLSDDGLVLYFQSFAGNIVEGDYNAKRDLFRVTLGQPDSDGDLMYDDWEVAYFDDFARDGTGDFDGDSHLDFDEFLAGTDPTNSSSILRVLTISSPNHSAKTLLWSAIPTKSYRVQYKESVNSGVWNELPGVITANGLTATATDASGGSTRFYRIVLVP